MVDVKLSGIIFTTLLVLFLFLSQFSTVIDISEEYNTELDPYIESTRDDYKNELSTIKVKSQNLQNDSTLLTSDADTFDVEGNFIVKGFNTARSAITSTNEVITVAYKLIRDSINKLNLENWILTILFTMLFISIILIILKITISKGGI